MPLLCTKGTSDTELRAKLTIAAPDEINLSIEFDNTSRVSIFKFKAFLDRMHVALHSESSLSISPMPGIYNLWFDRQDGNIGLQLQRSRLSLLFNRVVGECPSSFKVSLPVRDCMDAITKLYEIHCEFLGSVDAAPEVPGVTEVTAVVF